MYFHCVVPFPRGINILNCILFGSTAFLFGPGQQMRLMFDSVRIYATAIYLGCVVLALICALWVRYDSDYVTL